MTPNGTDVYTHIASNAYLLALLRMDTAYGQIIVSWDQYHDGGQTGDEGILSVGATGAGETGYAIGVSSTRQITVKHRGTGGSAISTTTLPTFQFAAGTSTVTLDLRSVTATTFDAHLYANGTTQSSQTGIDWLADSATAAFGADEGHGYIIGARATTAAARTNYLGSAASNSQIGRVLILRTTTLDTTLAANINDEMYRIKGERPMAILA
jgi:hypothetical protein